MKHLLYEAISLLTKYLDHSLLRPEKQVKSKEVEAFIRRAYDNLNSGQQFTPRDREPQDRPSMDQSNL